MFKKETDPSKLGKELSETITRRVIIGVLLMLMVLPLLTFGEIDYSSEYGIRELFWFGRSSCANALGDFYCDDPAWLTTDGWHELLREYVESSHAVEEDTLTKEVLWLYIPDFTKNGRMSNVSSIPQPVGSNSTAPYWSEVPSCAGFQISKDCPYRVEEMYLLTFTPLQCLDTEIVGCERLVSYARFNRRPEKVQEAILQFCTTIFTCCVLTIASLVFSNDAQKIVIRPI